MINQVLEALTADPNVWASTVMFVNYDENDGFFDHAVPPLPPAGTPDEFVSGLPIGLGVRVPMTVVSPWSRGGHVCSQVFDHTSVIRFIETWTGVREPNISAWRRQVCGDLTSALDFTSTVITVPPMPDTARLLQQAEHECSRLPPPLPRHGSHVPAQEPGTRPARALPYQANATGRADRGAGRFWITMTNGGTQSVHCAVHTNHYRVDGPWQYDIAPGAAVEDYFSAELFGGGKYDLSVYGPNGFRRRFIGNIDSAGGKLEANASYDFSTPGHSKLVISMVNRGSSAAVFTVASNAYRGDGPWLVLVAPGAKVDRSWDVQADTSGWYDFTVTVDADKLFSRTIAGHLELGVASITG